FADPTLRSSRSIGPPWRILYMITPGQALASELVRELAAIPHTQLTVTVGRDESLRLAIQSIRNLSAQKFEVIGWTTELPRLLSSHHVLVSKAGGATVQEAIAAGCPTIINQVVPGQQEGNARLIVETNSGVVASSTHEVIDALHRALEYEPQVLGEWP